MIRKKSLEHLEAKLEKRHATAAHTALLTAQRVKELQDDFAKLLELTADMYKAYQPMLQEFNARQAAIHGQTINSLTGKPHSEDQTYVVGEDPELDSFFARKDAEIAEAKTKE